MTTSAFVEARHRLEARDRSRRDKRVTLPESAQLVRDGDLIAVGGCLYSRTPLATLREILRRRLVNLTLVRNLTCYEGEWFMVAGAATGIITSWMGIGLPWGISPILRQYVEGGQVTYREWSHLAIGLGFRAGAMGIPFLPTLSMLGSDLIGTSGAKTMVCPFTGETVALVPALFPDVAVIHVHRADLYGNAQIDGYTHMDADIAAAATSVILTTEKLVSTDDIRQQPGSTVIPFFAVDAVVEVPLGSYPHECYGAYDADMRHIDSYARQTREHGADAVRSYLDEYIYGPDTFDRYLDLFGRDEIAAGQRRARELVG
jgi:glutaconate CoA-transferase subunit A